MEIIDKSFIKFDNFGSVLLDKFTLSGRVKYIILKCKSSRMGNLLHMKIGKTVITDKELIDCNCPYQPDGEIHFNSTYMEHTLGFKNINFNNGDTFEFEQPSDNVSEILLLIEQ